MKAYCRRARGRGGFTLVEMLVALVVVLIVVAATYAGCAAALGAYKKMMLTNEAAVLLDTVSTAAAGEIETARDVDGTTYTSLKYGRGASLVSDGGYLAVFTDPDGDGSGETHRLLSEETYTLGLRAQIAATYADPSSVTIQILDYASGDVIDSGTFSVRPLN